MYGVGTIATLAILFVDDVGITPLICVCLENSFLISLVLLFRLSYCYTLRRPLAKEISTGNVLKSSETISMALKLAGPQLHE